MKRNVLFVSGLLLLCGVVNVFGEECRCGDYLVKKIALGGDEDILVEKDVTGAISGKVASASIKEVSVTKGITSLLTGIFVPGKNTAHLAMASSISVQQRTISGKITDESGKGIPWVNIGIKNKNIGTVSDENGKYLINIPAINLSDTLSFTYVGFKSVNVFLKNIDSNNVFDVSLKEVFYNLPAITIKNVKPKIKKYGNTSYTPLIWATAIVKNDDIFEVGKLITLKKAVRLLSVNAFIGNQKLKDSVTYRLNFYRMKDGYPSERLIDKNITKSFALSASKISFDISAENLVMEEDFLVAIEYLPGKALEKSRIIGFRGNLGSSGGYGRYTSLGTWSQTKQGGAAIYVVAEE